MSIGPVLFRAANDLQLPVELLYKPRLAKHGDYLRLKAPWKIIKLSFHAGQGCTGAGTNTVGGATGRIGHLVCSFPADQLQTVATLTLLPPNCQTLLAIGSHTAEHRENP